MSEQQTLRFDQIDAGREYDLDCIADYVVERDNRLCQVCGSAGSELHHIVFKSLQGKDCCNNLILLCNKDHRMIQSNVKKSVWSVKRLQRIVAYNQKLFSERLQYV